MNKKSPIAVAAVLATALLAGCGGDPGSGSSAASNQATSSSPNAAAASRSAPASERSVKGTVVRFTAGAASVDVTIGEDSPATRDFLSMLPTTLELKEFNGREKIADLPRELNGQGTPGSDPADGDLIYYVPWGNIGFYYNASGIGYSDQTVHLGTYRASESELARFEGRQTKVEAVK